MENKILIFIMVSLLLFTLASAEIKTYTLDEEVDLKVICLNEGYCSSAAYCNINILAPNSSLIVIGQNMTNQTTFFNYTITPTDVGLYNVGGICIDGDDSKEVDFDFRVTKNGSEYTIPLSMNFLILTILLITMALSLGLLSIRAKSPIIMITLLALAVLIIIFNLGILVSLSDLTFENFTSLAGNVEDIFVLTVVLAGVGMFGIIVFLVVIALRMYWKMRGMTDVVGIKGL